MTSDETPARAVRVAAPDEPEAPAPARRAGLGRWIWPAALAVAAVVLFFCYWRMSVTVPDNSDGSDQALQAWDMFHGNWLLSGWIVGDVSYYTTEIPEYILVELVHGLNADAIHISAAITYALLVLAAGLLAKGSKTGREGLVRMLIGSGIMLAPQLENGVHLLILQPDHLGTQLPLLITFMVLDRAPRRWFTPVAITVMLTWVVISDRVALFDASLPLVAVGGLRVLAGLISAGDLWAPRRWPARLREYWFELSLVAAGIISFVAAEIFVHLIKLAGGYTSLPLPNHVVALRAIPHHVVVTAKGILLLYGADFSHGMSAGAAIMAAIHLVGVVLALWAFFLAFRHYFSTSELIIPVLATGIVFNLAAYFFSSVPATWFDTREIAAVLPFGAVLAGRQLAAPLARARLEPVLAVVLAAYVAMMGYGASHSAVADSESPVIGFLEAHHLSTGLGAYTEANLITLDSGGKVKIRTVTWRHNGAVPRAYESELSWYDPKLHYANFVVQNSADAGRADDIPYRDIVALAGPPAQTYHYKTFTIMVWNKNLLADLGHPPSAFPGDVH